MSQPTLLPGRRATALLLVLAPLTEVVEAVVSPLRGTSTAADLIAIAAHQDRFVLSVLVGLIGTLLYIPAFLGLAGACLAGGPRLARTAGWVAVASVAGFVGVRTVQGIQLQLVVGGFDRQAAGQLLDTSTANPIIAPLLVLFLGGSVVGIVLLAVATWRVGFPRPAVVLLALFPVADLAAKGHLGTIGSHVVLLVALGWLAHALRTPLVGTRLSSKFRTVVDVPSLTGVCGEEGLDTF